MELARKKSVRILGAVVAVVLLAVVAVKIFLPAEKIRDLALAQARARLGREVSVENVSVSLRGGLGVKMSDFAIHNPEGFGGKHLLEARAFDLKLAIRPLFKGEIRVDRLVIDGPVANLVRRADGTDNFTFSPAEKPFAGANPGAASEAAPAPPLSIASLTLTEGRISYSDEMAGKNDLQALEMNGLEMGLSLTDPAPGLYQATGQLSTDQIIVTGPSEVPDLNGTVDFDLTWDTPASRLSITRAEINLMDILLHATGHSITAGEAPEAHLQVKATDLPLTDLGKLAPHLPKLQGSGVLNATVDLELPPTAGAKLHARGQVTVREADLSMAQPFLPPEQPGQLAGRGDLDLTFDHSGRDSGGLTYTGKFTATGVSFTETTLVDELQKLNAVLEFNPDQINIESCEAKFASGTFQLRGTLRDPFPYFLPPELQEGVPMKTPHLSFAMRSPRLDVDRLLPVASPTGAPATRPVPSPSSVHVKRQFPDFTCDGTFRADSLIYMEVPFTNVLGQVRLRNRVFTFNEVKGQVYHGQVTGQVDVDLNELNDPIYSGSYQATDIQVNDFVTRFAGLAGVVFGGCNMGGSFQTHGLSPEIIRNSLTMNSDAVIREGKVITTGKVYQAMNQLSSARGQTLPTEQALRDLATHINVENGRVGLDKLTTRIGRFGDLTVEGYYGFNGDLDYSGTILLTKAETDSLFSIGAMKELAKLLGTQRPERLALPLSVGGTRTDPKVKLDLGSVTSDLQQRVVKEQGAKLEDQAKSKLNDLIKKWK